LDASLQTWIGRLTEEIHRAARWRLSFLGNVLRPFASLHRHRLDRLRQRLVGRVLSDRGSGTEMSGRYDSRVAATMYLRQHQSVSLTRPRHALLARAEVRAISKALKAARPRKRILDAPAGTGKLWKLLRGFGVPVVGVDASPEMLGRAPDVAGIERVHADVTNLPFQTGYFDLAICLRLFHRLPPRARRSALNELARVSNGRLIASYAFVSGVLRMRYWLVSQLRRSTEWAPHPVTRNQLLLELNSAGLELVSVRRVAGVLSNEVIITAHRVMVSRR